MQALYDNATVGLSGPVDYVHTCVDFGNVTLTVNGKTVCTMLIQTEPVATINFSLDIRWVIESGCYFEAGAATQNSCNMKHLCMRAVCQVIIEKCT